MLIVASVVSKESTAILVAIRVMKMTSKTICSIPRLF